MAALLVTGALLWLKIDPARELIPGIETVSQTALPVDLG
jgi:hypothetical protein